MLETQISFEGVNYEELALYIALNYSSPSQIPVSIRKIIPVRTKARGQRPGITSAAALSGKPTVSSGQWRFPKSQFTAEEKRMLLARAVALGVKAVFRNHLYQFAGKTYLQTNGAPIGVRLSCAVARLIMNTWDRKLKTILAKNKVKLETVFRYLDDWRGFLKALVAGWRWDRGQLRFRSAWREEDIKISPVERTCRELKKIMNSIYSNLQVEMEHAEMFEDKTLPTLDFRLFVQDNLVLYSFFQKPVANKCVIHKQSALGENSKIASHTQNLIRRMKCTSELLPMESRIVVIDEFCRQLISSGWGRDQVDKIVTAGLLGYENIKLEAKKSGMGIHKSAAEGAVARRRKKLVGKSSWFKNPPKSKTKEGPKHHFKKRSEVRQRKAPVSVLFCPQTPYGALANKLKENEKLLSELCGETVKIVERSGTTIKQILVKSNPWQKGTVCSRAETDCLLCKTGKGKWDCRKRNLCYETFCLRCKEAVENGEPGAKEAIYPGESARSGSERSKNHYDDYNNNLEASHMMKHFTNSHSQDGERPQFGMRVVRYHTSAVHRQIHEACMIWQRARQRNVVVLNSKSMTNRGSLKRLVIEDSTSEAENDNGFRRDTSGDQRHEGESIANGPSNSNNSVNTSMGITSSRKRKQTDGQTGGRTADIRSFMKKVTDRDKAEE